MAQQQHETAGLNSPRFEQAGALTLAGLTQRYACDGKAAIPAQWGRFAPHIDNVPGQVSSVTYGVCSNGGASGEFDYMCAVEVSGAAPLPSELVIMRVPSQRYAVFKHAGHVSQVADTIHAIMSSWLPHSGFEMSGSPDFLERYSEDFNPDTGEGSIEIWVPVRAK